jgi:hypothetical protein
MLTTIVLCGTDSAQLRLNYYLSNAVGRGYDHARVAGKFCILRTVSVRVVALELSLARDIRVALSSTIVFTGVPVICYQVQTLSRTLHADEFPLVRSRSDPLIIFKG